MLGGGIACVPGVWNQTVEKSGPGFWGWEGLSKSGFETIWFTSRRKFVFAKILRGKSFLDQVGSKTANGEEKLG